MNVWSRLRGRGQSNGPLGVAIKVKQHNRPDVQRKEAERSMPRRLGVGVVLATLFYIVAHYSVIRGVWPVHGTAPGSGGVLIRDTVSALAWVALFPMFRWLGYRGNWAVIALPIMIFFLTRPSLFQIFTDPVYQAAPGSRAEANALKAERSQLTTILRVYDEQKQDIVFRGPPPEIPDPVEAIRAVTEEERRHPARLLSVFPVMLAPLVLLLTFLWARRPEQLRWFREHRVWPFAAVMTVFFGIALMPSVRATGKLMGFTPWELFLPIFVGAWAAVLADDVYNLARPGQLISRRRILGLIVFGALPIFPFLLIHDFGLSVILAGSMATMLLVGTRRGWWAALMLGIWAVMVYFVFTTDDRSQTRLALAMDPYRDLSGMSEQAAEAWAAKVHQIKLFDANVLAGGFFGEGPGRGHAETAPNAADDGYITTIAAQWGLAGALALVLLYTAFVIQMLSVAVRERSAFERSLVTGLAMLVAIPFWLATLGGIRVIPLTGVAAAFAAHGGAKLLSSCIAIGIIAAISHRRAESDRIEAADRPAGDLSQQGIRVR